MQILGYEQFAIPYCYYLTFITATFRQGAGASAHIDDIGERAADSGEDAKARPFKNENLKKINKTIEEMKRGITKAEARKKRKPKSITGQTSDDLSTAVVHSVS